MNLKSQRIENFCLFKKKNSQDLVSTYYAHHLARPPGNPTTGEPRLAWLSARSTVPE